MHRRNARPRAGAMVLGLVAASLAASAAAQDAPPQAGQVLIVTVPAGALVSVDGREIGASPVSVGDLVPGAHLVSAVDASGARAERIVEVEAGRSTLVELALVAPQAAAPPASEPSEPAPPVEAAPAAAPSEMVESTLGSPSATADAPAEHVVDEPIAATGFPGLMGLSIGARLDVPIYLAYPVRMSPFGPAQPPGPIAAARLSFELGIDPSFGALAAIDLGSGAFGLGAAVNIPGYIPVSREVAVALQPRLAGIAYYHPGGAILLSIEAMLRVGIAPIPHLVVGGGLGVVVLGALPFDGALLVEGAYVGPILGGGVEWTFY